MFFACTTRTSRGTTSKMASFRITTGILFALFALQILAAEDEKSPKARLEVGILVFPLSFPAKKAAL